MREEKVLTKEIAVQFLADDGNDSAGDWVCEVDLSEFTAIGDDAAALLSNYYESTLYLNGLRHHADSGHIHHNY